MGNSNAPMRAHGAVNVNAPVNQNVRTGTYPVFRLSGIPAIRGRNTAR